VETPDKAQIQKLDAAGKQSVASYTVQFNPDSLKVTFANQTQPPSGNAPRDASQGTSATQFVGRGTTKLNVTLWFDVTAELTPAAASLAGNPPDVRRLTAKIVELLATQPTARENQPVPPSVRFLWGTFQFDGIIDSVDQSLEFFSPQGVPLRASLTLSMSQAVIDYAIAALPPSSATAASAAANGQPSNAPAGTRPMTSAPAGTSLQAMASAQGTFGDWQAIAAANNIENPRLLATGQLIDMNARLRS
jgi:hypothetical protein